MRERPPERALRWLEAELGVAVVGVRAVKGGSSSAIHAVRVTRGSAAETVILRRYVTEGEPGAVEREARVLSLLERCQLPTPALLATDPTGATAGVPALVMTRLPGRLDWSPIDMDSWLHRLAEVLPVIHATPIGVADGVQPFTPYEPESWDPPAWLDDDRLWERALSVFHGPRLDPDDVFIHRDYHPGNVLWRGGRVSGIVDWQAASIGPRTADVWHCRGNLLSRFGMQVADRFLSAWRSISGCDYHPWAETVMLVDAIGWKHPQPGAEQDALRALLARRLAELGS